MCKDFHIPVPVFVERKSDAALIVLEWRCSRKECGELIEVEPLPHLSESLPALSW